MSLPPAAGACVLTPHIRKRAAVRGYGYEKCRSVERALPDAPRRDGPAGALNQQVSDGSRLLPFGKSRLFTAQLLDCLRPRSGLR
jgi:hypothetical protein